MEEQEKPTTNKQDTIRRNELYMKTPEEKAAIKVAKAAWKRANIKTK